MKILTGVLGGIGTVACLSTIGIFGYALAGKEPINVVEESNNTLETQLVDYSSIVPQAFTKVPDSVGIEEISYAEHTHNYTKSVDVKANCYREGKLKYSCDICGNTYYIDVPITEHKEDPEWVIVRKPTLNESGLQVKYCVYCDSIVIMEDIPYLNNEKYINAEGHIHNYTVITEREPTCVFSGLRKYTCDCGDIYSEQISALGHVATDWITVEEPTTSTLGAEQRTCAVCGVVLDIRRLAVKETTPRPFSDTSGTASNTTAPMATIRPQSTPATLPRPTNTPRPTESPRPMNTPQPTITPKPTNTTSPDYDWQKKVIDVAKMHLKYGTGYSRDFLIKMLEEIEGFTHEEAIYGVDHCGADWKNEAIKSAKNHLEYGTGYSRNFLIKMLEEIEKFTHEEAIYGVDYSGADWKNEAVKSAKNHLEYGTEYSRDFLIKMLEEIENFTHEEAIYGVDHCGVDW